MKRMIYCFLFFVLMSGMLHQSFGQNGGLLFMYEDFGDTLFPKPDWLADGVARSTTVGSFVSAPASASFNAHNGSLTLPEVSHPVMVRYQLGRTTSGTAKLMFVEVSTESATGTWLPVDTFSNDDTGYNTFTTCETDLTAFSSYTSVWIRFRKASATTSPWRLDDVEVFNTYPLPVTLTTFKGEYLDGEGVKLTWSTATEEQNAFFDVQRSVDGLGFSSIGRVPGGGSSLMPLHYAFADPAPAKPVSFYRLIQHDYDGKQNPSGVIMVKTTCAIGTGFEGLNVFANQDGVTIGLDSPVS
ncbi:MAG: hypothetical protein R6V49_03125, partial [Bacteroidales bacterium]